MKSPKPPPPYKKGYLRHQLPVIASLGETALTAVVQRLRGGRADSRPPPVPGPEFRATMKPRPPDLIDDYVRHIDGDPARYRDTVPPHLFPQWGFALAAKTLRGLPYPVAKALNGGCRLEIHAPLPRGEPIEVSAQLEDIDDDGRRAVLRQKIVSGTASSPGAVVGYFYVIVPLGGGGGTGKRAKPTVPDGATELATWDIPADAGLSFAMLTGDFNPVHWVRPYARAFGFKSTILHGFSTMARAAEGLADHLSSGSLDPVRVLDVQFTRPLVLPARAGLYVGEGGSVHVGDGPGGFAYLVGTYETG